jgi:hypothetical protein
MLSKFRVCEDLKFERDIIVWAIGDSLVNPGPRKCLCPWFKDNGRCAFTDLMGIALPSSAPSTLQNFTNVCAPTKRRARKFLFAHGRFQVSFMQFSEDFFFHLLNRCWRKIKNDLVFLASALYRVRRYHLHGVVEIPANPYPSNEHQN